MRKKNLLSVVSRTITVFFMFSFSLVQAAELRADQKGGVFAEVHAILCDMSRADVLNSLHIKNSDGEDRSVGYFDTKELDLYRGRLIFRTRFTESKTELTVKIQGLRAPDVDPRFFALADFKCERDVYGQTFSDSCSLNSSPDLSSIQAATHGSRSIDQLFSEDQLEFIKQYSSVQVPSSAVLGLGSIPTRYWKFSHPEFHHALTFEHWKIADGLEMMDLSSRSDISELPQLNKAMQDFVAKNRLTLCPDQTSKTRATLEFLASHL